MDADPAAMIQVEVAFATPERQRIIALTLPAGTTARDAVDQAALHRHFPDWSEAFFTGAALGLFGKVLRDPSQHALRDGDRVEVYRPLKIDPKAARLARAAGKRG